jgi:hypothetical protein
VGHPGVAAVNLFHGRSPKIRLALISCPTADSASICGATGNGLSHSPRVKLILRLAVHIRRKGDPSMTEQTTNQVKAPESKTFKIVRKIVLFVVLGIVGFTIFMATARKFGWL